MLETSTLRRPRAARRHRVVVRLLALTLLVAAAAAVPTGRALLHRGETMPGVAVLGADVSGRAPEEAGVRIRMVTGRRLRTPVHVTARGEQVEILPSRLFTLDRGATVQAAMSVGRGSWLGRARSLLSRVTAPVEIEPVLVVRPKAEQRLAALLRRFATPAVSAGVEIRGTEPVVRRARPGAEADLASLVAALERRVVDGAGAVEVGFHEATPAIEDGAARAAAENVRVVLSAPVALTLDGRPIGSLSPMQLASLVTFAEHGSRLAVLLDEERLARVLDPRIAPFKTRAVNARFEVDGARAHVIAARPGTTLDSAAALVSVVTAAHRRGERTAGLSLKPIPAELTTEKALGLGIRERVSSFTTEMGPSSANRIHNVHLMADYIDGTIVRPGETFSFNDSVGPRTPERGFLEGQMIVGSLLLPSIGGGVCQTATTLFNNAFELGLPVGQRQNHSFYISHYPMGRDATVSWGGPDFSFTNDMEHALLIKASYTSDTLTFTFYGSDEGRKVESRTGPQTNWREPKLTYALDPAAPEGSMRVERGAHQRGFDVTVFRKVTRNGRVIREDSFASRYIAVGDTAIYGPGSTIPGEYFVIPTT